MASTKRSVIRRLIARFLAHNKAAQPQTESARASSFPFVSGDTFRLMSSVEFTAEGAIPLPGPYPRIAFVSSDVAAQETFGDRYREWASHFPATHKPLLLIHNSDRPIERQRLMELAECSVAVGAVNVVEEEENIFALPIGLENAHLDNNGRLSLYLGGVDPNDARTRMVLSSFHVETNPILREPARDTLAGSRFGYDGFQWKRGEYRQEVKRTKFVICPPGNGHDTHRTWEAIYLGAVPVVMRGYLAQSLLAGAPILEVSNYADFVSLSDEELSRIYTETRSADPSKAYAQHWVRKFSLMLGADN